MDSLDSIFKAQSVALVGASSDQGKLGYMTLDSIIKGGYEGKIYPVNPKGGEILGLPVYRSLNEIPEPVDLAVVIVPPRFVPQVMREAVEKGIPGAVILTAGFKEAGQVELEEEIKRIAKEGRLRFVGPNVQGINYLPNKLCAMFFPVITTRGPLAVITQSGSATAALSEWAVDDGLGITAAVNLGNQADLCESDYLEYFGKDEGTKAVAMAIEGLEAGRRFLSSVSKVSREKPVVVLKTGRSEIGKRAAASHTGSLAGNHKVFTSALKQAGGIPAENLTDLYDRSKGAMLIKQPDGNRVLSISTSGGMGALAADEAEAEGLDMPSLSGKFIQALRAEKISHLANMANPLDLGYVGIEDFITTATLGDQHEIADVILLNFGDPIPGAVDAVKKMSKKLQSSLVVSYCGGGAEERSALVEMHRAEIAVFPSPERAIRGIGASVSYAEWRRRAKGSFTSFDFQDSKPSVSEPKLLTEPEAVKELAGYGISYPEHGLARSAEEAVHIADALGYPVVLKIVSPQISHKTDVGGVFVGLDSDRAVKSAYKAIINKIKAAVPESSIEGVLVCRQAKEGQEVIVGAVIDPVFGPTVMFGLGGVFAEVLKDVTFRVAPFCHSEARAMIREIRGFSLLSGVRGASACDLDALTDLLVATSRLMVDKPRIKELDFNPVRLYPDGLSVLDVRVMAGKS
ncbi:MAG: acetate--CoA ligase family protein [Syntrophaceae bacterium]|nr:acetate--CoA ligase family protein [Syntrophaceae bacterium]